jgi:hypothetical protein
MFVILKRQNYKQNFQFQIFFLKSYIPLRNYILQQVLNSHHMLNLKIFSHPS